MELILHKDLIAKLVWEHFSYHTDMIFFGTCNLSWSHNFTGPFGIEGACPEIDCSNRGECYFSILVKVTDY
jgi:putative lipase involved disintegration of autophagic bodies